MLEMAHMSEDNANSNSSSSAPSRERIIDKLIIKNEDVITLNAANVDLEYAVRGEPFFKPFLARLFFKEKKSLL